MAFLLDTNVLSEPVRPRPHPGVLTWLSTLKEGDSFVSAVTIGEIHRGIITVRDRSPDKAARLEAWLTDIETTRRDSLLAIDAETCKRWVELRLRCPKGSVEDLFIAATASVHGLTVATRNVRDFQDLGIPLFNPFEPGHSP